MSKYTASYISNTSECEDRFDNKPHESVSDTLVELLSQRTEIKHPVIGIEGEWGAGKTNVLKMLERKLEQRSDADPHKYMFYTYDVWGLQEDLTRRSFLDNLIKEISLPQNKIYFQRNFQEEQENLSARRTTRIKRTFPYIRFSYILILLIPIAIFIINTIENLFGYRADALITYDQLKGIVSTILMVFIAFEFYKEYNREYELIKTEYQREHKPTSNKSLSKDEIWDLRKKTLGRLIYVFQGKEIENNEKENVIEDEPSVCRFQSIFDSIISDMKNNTTLVVVFDNMDRLCDLSKLMSVWTSLHTFFAEKQYNGKVWVFVPYDRKQMTKIFTPNVNTKDHTVDEFLNKTFFTSFKIPTPILSMWKKFLYETLDRAFTPNIPEEEKRLLSIIFSNSTDIEFIKPREIIAYVNNLVSLYNWKTR